MDDLLDVLAIRNLENAEQRNRPRNRHHSRDPFENLNEMQFIKMFRLSKDLVYYLVDLLEPYIRPPNRATSLDITTKILIALKFYATGSYQPDVGQNVYLDVSQSAVSNVIKEVTDALLQPEIFDEWIKFPQTFEQLNAVRQKFYDEHGFPGVVGCIDCTHVAIVPPSSDDPDFP